MSEGTLCSNIRWNSGLVIWCMPEISAEVPWMSISDSIMFFSEWGIKAEEGRVRDKWIFNDLWSGVEANKWGINCEGTRDLQWIKHGWLNDRNIYE